MKKLFTVVMLGLLLASAFAQQGTRKFNSYFEALHQNHELNGNVKIADGGKLIYARSFGYKDFRNGQLNNADTQFELASVSKLFTATCILQLSERGLLKLDDDFSRYFPQFPYRGVTIRHLLSHTSGLPDTETLLDSLIRQYPERQFTIHDELPSVLTYSKNHHLLFQPGERWSYSSAGYHLLALLVEKLSGEKFAHYLQEHIFKPAGMTHTYLQVTMAQKKEPNRAKNYQYNNHFEMKVQFVDTLSDWKEWTYNLALMAGGGGIVSTAADMLRFDRALRTQTILSKNAQEEAYRPYLLNNGQPAQPLDVAYCGLGWFISTNTSHGRMVWGSGANPGTISFFARNVDRDQCIAILHNVKSNGFQDLMAMDLVNGKDVRYKISFGFLYAQDLYQRGGDYAKRHLQQLQSDTAHYELREADLDRAALELRRTGARKLVLDLCDLHVKQFPASADAYHDRATALTEYGKKEEAIRDYEQALALDPNDKASRQALTKLKDERLK